MAEYERTNPLALENVVETANYLRATVSAIDELRAMKIISEEEKAELMDELREGLGLGGIKP